MLQEPPTPDIPRITLDPVNFSVSNDEREGGADQADASDDEFFDATDEAIPGLSSEQLEVISPSISVLSFEGDPPEIEEDRDFREINSVEGKRVWSCVQGLPVICDGLAVGLVRSNKSIVLQLLSQIRIGMDLTRIVLPAFIFEKRSLLEMYAEFFSHPDIIIR